MLNWKITLWTWSNLFDSSCSFILWWLLPFGEPDPIDTIQRAGSTRFGTVEELEGVGVEGESLEHLDEAVGEDVVKVEDVQGDVHHRANEDEASEEGNDAHHSPISSLNTDLESMF